MEIDGSMLRSKEPNEKKLRYLSTAELWNAELKIFRKIQSELKSLKANGNVDKESKLYQLCLFIGDDDVIRI